jgi:pimeloyl-ACP methyl ester carboxylesterase
MAHSDIARLDVESRSIAYRLRRGNVPTLVFLPGYASDMEGTKARALDGFATANGLAMLRLDYSGTGSSSGRFEDGTLALWLEEALAAVDELTRGPLIVVGSSMGGWIGLHLALLRPDRMQALIGIAAAPDFTNWGFADGADAQRQGIAPGFWQSGQQLLLLDGEIAIDCPVRLLHGQRDADVPWHHSLHLAEKLRSADVQTLLVKDGDHRLSRDSDIALLVATVASLMELK